jgi:YfiH family protein
LNTLQLIMPQWSAPSNIGALCTTRFGGSSLPPYDDGVGGGGLNLGTHVGDDARRVAFNRGLLRAYLPNEPIWLAQVHGNTVVDAAEAQSGVEADAIIATGKGQVCCIQTADCLPVLFCSTDGKVVGAAHAGWRGLAAGVLENTVKRMQASGAGEIMAWLGPAIGPQRFEVGGDVKAAFADKDARAATAFQAYPDRDGKYLADIYALARLRLQNVGIQQIHGGGMCTVSDSCFYSYRRDHVTGRMASLIWIN